MIKRSIQLAVLISFLTSCYRKPEVVGYVYSKHGVLMPWENITLSDRKGSVKAPSDDKIVTTTNGSGFYYFTFKMKNNHLYTIRCESDSGKALGGFIRDTKSNRIDLYFQ